MTRITSLVALAAAMAAASVAFPVTVEVHNNCWRLAIEPESSTEVAPFGTSKVLIKDESQAARLLCNVDALNTMAGWPEGVGLSVHYPLYVAEVPADAEAEAAAAEVSAQAEAAAATPPPAPAPAPAGKAKR